MFNATILGQVFVNGVSLSAIYILVALGFTLLFGIMRVVNFAHGEFAMLGAFALFYLMKTLQWHWVFALPIGVILDAQVTATGEITVVLLNKTGGDIDLNGNLRIVVWKH